MSKKFSHWKIALIGAQMPILQYSVVKQWSEMEIIELEMQLAVKKLPYSTWPQFKIWSHGCMKLKPLEAICKQKYFQENYLILKFKMQVHVSITVCWSMWVYVPRVLQKCKKKF